MDSDTRKRWSSRKFWAAMFWQAVMVALLAMERLPPDAFVTVTIILLGSYFASNTAQHIWESRS